MSKPRELYIGADVAHPSRAFTLPLEAVTRTFFLVGKRGSGKSNAGVVVGEEVIKAGARFVGLDPVGHFWGLKARPDGSPGFPVYVFGGPHADLPLEPTSGALMAQVVAESASSIALCTVEFSGKERAQFVTAFLNELLKLLLSRNYAPILLIVEEADAFAPQRPMAGEEKMLGATDAFVRRARQGGGGILLITQRSAAINKNVTTQADTLIAFRTLGPQDRNAIDEWVKFHDSGARRTEVLSSLATLKDGESWLWSPEWLDFFGRVQWRRRETFDAAATPKVGERAVQPKLAEVDLEQLRTRMAATIERAKAEDPKELRRRIVELERQVAEGKNRDAHPLKELVEVEKIVQLPVLNDQQIEQLRNIVDATDSWVHGILEKTDRLMDAAMTLNKAIAVFEDGQKSAGRSRAKFEHKRIAAEDVVTSGVRVLPGEEVSAEIQDIAISASQQRILDALGRLESVRVTEATRPQLAGFAGVSPTSSAFGIDLAKLKRAELVEYGSGGRVALTPFGRTAAAAVEIPVSTAELHTSIAQIVGAARWNILKQLIAIYPKQISRAELAERAGVSQTSSAYGINLRVLNSMGFVDYPDPGYVAAEPVLFVEEAMVAARR